MIIVSGFFKTYKEKGVDQLSLRPSLLSLIVIQYYASFAQISAIILNP
ncbi:hypothetical protein SAMN05428949_5195 [Chitinophaga sp. YR627]|nr:hypothetical protein SAMN05428949_5195 [Chitinophaga sp. YR627]